MRALDVLKWLAMATGGGAALGAGSLALDPDGRAVLSEKITPIAVGLGLMRARAPQVGDNWTGCNAARAAGTAPIYVGEPGYTARMDGDGDGVACEWIGGSTRGLRRRLRSHL